MKLGPRAFPVLLLLVGCLSAAGGAAHALTLTPAPTPTPSPQQVDTLQGQAWLNGQVSGGPITAEIGGIVCSEPSTSVTPADSTVSVYTVRVLSNDLRPGCGTAGAAITFFVEGQQASQTAVWEAGGSQPLTLIAGPSFARFSGRLSIGRTAGQSMVPFSNDRACGYDIGGGFVDPEHVYQDIAFSNERQPGCGTEGGEVTFKLLDAQGNVIAVAKEKGVWHAWDGVSSPQELNLTFGPATAIKMGNVGTGDGQRSATGPWTGLSVVLLSIGVSGLVAGIALRRRAGAR